MEIYLQPDTTSNNSQAECGTSNTLAWCDHWVGLCIIYVPAIKHICMPRSVAVQVIVYVIITAQLTRFKLLVWEVPGNFFRATVCARALSPCWTASNMVCHVRGSAPVPAWLEVHLLSRSSIQSSGLPPCLAEWPPGPGTPHPGRCQGAVFCIQSVILGCKDICTGN